ncbi:hypothetical protein [Embleya sp. NPDC020630]|uniref:hypothetical protein n=1 Tax=Embleya sp. NPDC020630 TaxID=3363979 RepID=UPI003787FA9B
MSTSYKIPALTRDEVPAARDQQRRPTECGQCAGGTPVDHWPSPVACTSSYRRDDNGVERLFRVHCTCDYCF